MVFASNTGEGLRALGWLPPEFPYASGNLDAIVQVGEIFAMPSAVAAVLFAGVVAWDGINTILLGRAVLYASRIRGGDYRPVNLAFTVALGLWGALLVADEVFLAYRVASFEQTHRAIFTAMLASLLAIRLLPNE